MFHHHWLTQRVQLLPLVSYSWATELRSVHTAVSAQPRDVKSLPSLSYVRYSDTCRRITHVFPRLSSFVSTRLCISRWNIYRSFVPLDLWFGFSLLEMYDVVMGHWKLLFWKRVSTRWKVDLESLCIYILKFEWQLNYSFYDVNQSRYCNFINWIKLFYLKLHLNNQSDNKL